MRGAFYYYYLGQTTPPTGLNVWVNIDAVWKQAISMHVNIDGIWKQLSAMHVNIDGIWKN